MGQIIVFQEKNMFKVKVIKVDYKLFFFKYVMF